VSPIGAGGMGEVYKPHDARRDRTVAIRVLTADRATPESVQPLDQEARAASALNHLNIPDDREICPSMQQRLWSDEYDRDPADVLGVPSGGNCDGPHRPARLGADADAHAADRTRYRRRPRLAGHGADE
jgi:hypothetical protein